MSKGAMMRLSLDQKYRFGKKYGACVTGKRDWVSRFRNKSEMERRLSEIVSAETLTKCILFRALPSPGVTCFWTTALALGDCP
jgi:hypothetical protein